MKVHELIQKLREMSESPESTVKAIVRMPDEPDRFIELELNGYDFGPGDNVLTLVLKAKDDLPSKKD